MRKGDFTGYKDTRGKDIHFGDLVKIGGELFEVEENPFNGLLVVDGDSGQQYLSKVHRVCHVFGDMTEAEILTEIGQARSSFINAFLREPNAVFIGSNLLEVLKYEMRQRVLYSPHTYVVLPGADFEYQIMNMKVVPVDLSDYISVGFEKRA